MKTELISPADLKNRFPLTPELKKQILTWRARGENVLRGMDESLVLALGPCSIHDEALALDYAARLKTLIDEVDDHLFLVMRVFLEKPRTQFGWKGFLTDPELDGSSSVEKGLFRSRQLLLEIAKMGVPVATEFLDPLLSDYHRDLISWGMIGARTSASQIHRQMVSQFDFPVGFKNSTDGDMDNAICGALAARHPQTLIGISDEGQIASQKSAGNPYTHIVLRGGTAGSNYDSLSISRAIQKQRIHGLDSPLMIDCSHGNSGRDHRLQREVFNSVREQIEEGNGLIMGMMLESHLQEGHATSITDPCIAWEETAELIKSISFATK